MRDFGGRAMCPADEYDDPAIREEMAWHAFEEALADAGWLEWARSWPAPHARLAPLFRNVPIGGDPVIPPISVVGHRLELRATTDSHLGEDASGLVDLTATLVPTSASA